MITVARLRKSQERNGTENDPFVWLRTKEKLKLLQLSLGSCHVLQITTVPCLYLYGV